MKVVITVGLIKSVSFKGVTGNLRDIMEDEKDPDSLDTTVEGIGPSGRKSRKVRWSLYFS